MFVIIQPLFKMHHLTDYEYILVVNLVNRTNYKLNICEKKGDGTLFWAVSLISSGLFTFVDYPIREPSLEIETCSDWSAILEKNKRLIFARAFGDRRLGRVVSGAASRSEAMGSILACEAILREGIGERTISIPTRDFPPWLRGRIVSPSKVGILSDWIWRKVFFLSL